MVSSTMYHPGLVLATLIVQFVTVRSASISGLKARRRGGGSGGGDKGDPPPATAPPATAPPATAPNSSVGSSASESTSTSASSTYHSTTPTLPSSAASTNLSTSTSSTSTFSSGSTNSSSPTTSPVIGAVRSNISTPGIIGAVIGSVVIGVFLLFLLAMCIRRARRARSSQGGLPTMLLARDTGSRTPMTEMSQTQSNPLISSAVAAGATTSNPFLSRYSRSFTPSTTTASLSPLSLAGSLPRHSRSVGSSSGRSTADTRATADLDILQPPLNSSPIVGNSGLLPIIAAASSSASHSTSESSGLHSAMTAHQKALEDDKGRGAGNMDIEKIEGVNDPPPEYNA